MTPTSRIPLKQKLTPSSVRTKWNTNDVSEPNLREWRPLLRVEAVFLRVSTLKTSQISLAQSGGFIKRLEDPAEKQQHRCVYL